MQSLGDRLEPALFSLGTVLMLGVLLAAAPARAETLDAAPTTTSTNTLSTKKPAGPKMRVETFRAIVRGFYLEAKLGGGYTLADPRVHKDVFNPDVHGRMRLGGGAGVAVAMGYDIVDSFALQLMAGDKMLSGRRTDEVRDVSLMYVGFGPRFIFSVSDRFKFLITPGVAGVMANDAVDPSNALLPGVLLGVGLEYYAHVRHFSVGLEMQLLASADLAHLGRSRYIFLGLTPTVKYTF